MATQQIAFEQFIDGAACLRRQRGRIMNRNSCRSPWTHLTNVAVRQTLPTARGQSVAFDLQVFNLPNLLNARWGRVQIPPLATPSLTTQLPLLSQVGQTSGAPSQAQPIYRFDPTTRRYSSQNIESSYQIQLAARYNF